MDTYNFIGKKIMECTLSNKAKGIWFVYSEFIPLTRFQEFSINLLPLSASVVKSMQLHY